MYKTLIKKGQMIRMNYFKSKRIRNNFITIIVTSILLNIASCSRYIEPIEKKQEVEISVNMEDNNITDIEYTIVYPTIITSINSNIDVKKVVSTLSVAEKQIVEIAKAFLLKSNLIILDEPTTVLNQQETNVLFNIMKDYVSKGNSIIYG